MNQDAPALRDYIVELVTEIGDDPELLETRDAYQPPATSASSVTIVTSKGVCDRAGQAYDHVFHGTAPAPSRSFVLIKVPNSRYVAFDVGELVGKYSIDAVFSEWSVLAAFGW